VLCFDICFPHVIVRSKDDISLVVVRFNVDMDLKETENVTSKLLTVLQLVAFSGDDETFEVLVDVTAGKKVC